jgi:putative sigma-54 modulation protein
MKTTVHAVNFTIDSKLVEFIHEKMQKLEKYYDKVIASDVFLKVEQTSEKENKLVEVKILIPGDEFIVKKQCKSFEEAMQQSADSLEIQLIKTKEKRKE